MARKPRSDAKLRNLPPDQRTALTDWLVDEGISYEAAKKRLKSEFGVSTSYGAVADFWQKECFSLRFRKARGVAEEIVGVMRESENDFDEATLTAIGQRAFNLAVAKDADVGELVNLVKVIGESKKLQLQSDKLSLEKRRVRMLEKKAAKLDQLTNDLDTDDGLTPEERLQKIREGLLI